MHPEIKAKWVAALRSGEYKQATGQLRRNTRGKTSFCCLGVLCNLHAQAHPEIAAQQTDPESYMCGTKCLPTAVMEWADLPSPRGDTLKIGNTFGSLSYHNDSWCTFAQIADAIESQL